MVQIGLLSTSRCDARNVRSYEVHVHPWMKRANQGEGIRLLWLLRSGRLQFNVIRLIPPLSLFRAQPDIHSNGYKRMRNPMSEGG